MNLGLFQLLLRVWPQKLYVNIQNKAKHTIVIFWNKAIPQGCVANLTQCVSLMNTRWLTATFIQPTVLIQRQAFTTASRGWTGGLGMPLIRLWRQTSHKMHPALSLRCVVLNKSCVHSSHLVMCCCALLQSLQWRHNNNGGVSIHQRLDCLFNHFLGADQRKQQSSASLAFVRGIHWWPVDSPLKGPVTRKMFPFDDVIMMPVNITLVGVEKQRIMYWLEWWPEWLSLMNTKITSSAYTVRHDTKYIILFLTRTHK